MLEPGTTIAGFRVDGVLGRGSHGVVYEATQLGLDRRVALRVLPPDHIREDGSWPPPWPEHPHVVSMYAAGRSEHGPFVAMRLVPGVTLAELVDGEELDHDRALDLLGEISAALESAHAEEIVHGAVNAGNVLIDREGRPFLSDFGLGPDEATPESDTAAFAALASECLGNADMRQAPPPRAVAPRRRGRIVVIAGIAAIAAAAALAVVIAGSGDDQGAPPVADGERPLGSALLGGGERSVDCDGNQPTGSSLGCTLVQTRLPGRPLVAGRDGAIRQWVVRGARGELALQVIRGEAGSFKVVGNTQYAELSDPGTHVLPADLAIRAGDRVAVEVPPGSAVGVRSAPDATTSRFFGPLRHGARPTDRPPGSGFDFEVLLRVDYEPGGAPRLPRPLTGPVAAEAPPGRRLDQRVVELSGPLIRTVAVARLDDRVALDLFRRGRRLARIDVAGADPRGELLELSLGDQPQGKARATPEVEWRNPDGDTILHHYRASGSSLAARD